MRLERAVEKFLRGYFATRDLSEKTYKAYAGDLRWQCAAALKNRGKAVRRRCVDLIGASNLLHLQSSRRLLHVVRYLMSVSTKYTIQQSTRSL